MTLELINPDELSIHDSYTQVIAATCNRLVFVAAVNPIFTVAGGRQSGHRHLSPAAIVEGPHCVVGRDNGWRAKGSRRPRMSTHCSVVDQNCHASATRGWRL